LLVWIVVEFVSRAARNIRDKVNAPPGEELQVMGLERGSCLYAIRWFLDRDRVLGSCYAPDVRKQ